MKKINNKCNEERKSKVLYWVEERNPAQFILRDME